MRPEQNPKPTRKTGAKLINHASRTFCFLSTSD